MQKLQATNKNSGTVSSDKPSKTVMAGMAGCYALGNFTDNFFKQASIIMAAALGLTTLQSVATVLFALPFILFSAWAGWLADRAPKNNIVIGAKALELAAMSLGAIMLWQAWWPGIMAVIFIMAVQSTIFIPALNGAIPENFAHNDVPRVNSIIRSISTAAILAGMALAGPLLDARPGGIFPEISAIEGQEYGRIMAGVFAVCISSIGFLAAFVIKRQRKNTVGSNQFPWFGPVDSLRYVLEYRKDKALFTVMTGDAFFYGLAPVVLISIANLAKQMGYSDTLTSLLSASLMVGIAIGALIGGRYTPESWRRLMIPSLSVMALCLALASLTTIMPVQLQLAWLATTLLCAGVWGGIYIIPISSFMQVHPPAGEKGRVLGASNFYSFLSMAIFGAAFSIISLVPAQLTFIIYAAIAFIFAQVWVHPQIDNVEGSTLKDQSRSLLGAITRAILSLRYNIKEQGLAQIKADSARHKRPILFLPNHPALIDPIIVYSQLSGLRPRILSDQKSMEGPVQKIIVKLFNIITIPDIARDGRKQSLESVRKGLDKICEALKSGDNVLLYPAGRIYRSQNEEIGANSSVYRILAAVPETRIILVRTTGLWGSSFSRAGGNTPDFFDVLLKHLPALLANLIFFMPRRKVKIDFVELTEPPSQKMILNRTLERYYNATSQAAFSIPFYPWQGKKYLPLPTSNKK